MEYGYAVCGFARVGDIVGRTHSNTRLRTADVSIFRALGRRRRTGENVVVEFMDTFERKNHEETLFSKRIFAEVVLDKALLEGSGEGGRSSMSSDSSRNIGGAINTVV